MVPRSSLVLECCANLWTRKDALSNVKITRKFPISCQYIINSLVTIDFCFVPLQSRPTSVAPPPPGSKNKSPQQADGIINKQDDSVDVKVNHREYTRKIRDSDEQLNRDNREREKRNSRELSPKSPPMSPSSPKQTMPPGSSSTTNSSRTSSSILNNVLIPIISDVSIFYTFMPKALLVLCENLQIHYCYL